jgi:hypothetical protein
MKSADASNPLETRAEIFRIAKRIAPCLDSLDSITFLGDPASDSQRRNWIDAVWLPILCNSLQNAHTLCKQGHRELIQLDQKLDARLAGPIAKSSRAAGRELALHSTAPAAENHLARYLEDVRRSNTPGHFAIVFGARASAFHIPVPASRAALVFLEMRSAQATQFWPIVEECLAALPPAPNQILAA